MVVLGIDLGTKNICVATPKIHSFGIVLNREAKRLNDGILGFTEQEGRLYGSIARSRQKRNVRNTLYELIRLIGRKWTDEDLGRDAMWWGFDLVKNPHAADTIAVEVTHNNQRYVLGPEQLLAAYISFLRDLAISDLRTKDVRDCCVAVPTYFNYTQRKMVANACKIAGMNLLRIVNSTTAVALMWGLNPMDTELKSQYVMFVDIGYANTQVAVAEYVAEEKSMQIICHTGSRIAGGRDINRAMIEHFVFQINQKYSTNILSEQNPNWKVIHRLSQACDKLKKKLGLNNEASVTIDCLLQGDDYKIQMNREKLHELMEPVLSRMLKPIKDALVQLNQKLSLKSNEAKFQCVELVGGGLRVPHIKQKIEEMIELAKKEIPNMENCIVRKTMNGDECVSKGTAYLATMLSKSYKVRQMKFTDMTNFDIHVVSGAEPKKVIPVDLPQIPLIDVINRPIWRRGSKTKSTRTLHLDVKQAEQLIRTPSRPQNYILISQNNPEDLNFGADTWLCKIFIMWDQIANHRYSDILKEHLRTELDRPVILMARIGTDDLLGEFEAYCPILTSVLDAFEKKKKEAEDALKPKEKKGPNKSDGDKKDEQQMDIDEKESTATESKEMDTSGDKESKQEKNKKKNINRKTKIALRVTTEFILKNMVPLDEACALETMMKKLDDDIANIQNTRNFLETLIYEVRDKLDGEYIPVIDPRYLNGHKDTIAKLMYKLEDEEEISKDFMTYTRDIEIIKSITKPMDKLIEEHRMRAQKVAELTQQIKQYHTTAESAKYMDNEKKKKVLDKCNDVHTWLMSKLGEQAKQPLWVSVAVTVSLLKQKLNELDVFCRPLCKEPTPPPPPPPPAEKKSDAANKDEKKMETDETAETADVSTKAATGDMDAESAAT